jgi:hypothetical protein
MARSRRTTAMLLGRCSRELSDSKLQRKIKKSQTPSEADLSRRAGEGSAVSADLSWKCFSTGALIARLEPLAHTPTRCFRDILVIRQAVPLR